MDKFWKIKKSRKAGVIPNVNHFPDADTAIWNQKDGKLYLLQVEDDGTRTVVLVGGGINTIGETHSRLHALDSEDDHLPIGPRIFLGNPEEYDRTPIAITPETAKIMLGQFDGIETAGSKINFIVAGSETPIAITVGANDENLTFLADGSLEPALIPFSDIDHNKLKNYAADRHLKFNFFQDLKTFKVQS